MRRNLFTGALAVSLIASGVAFASTKTSRATRPDLVVSSVSNPPDVTFPGHAFSVTDRTRNVGGARARGTVTRYYLSSSGKRTAIGGRSIVSLRSGASSRGSAKATVPVTIEFGTYSLVACADARGAVREANERNNCRTAAKTVTVKKLPPPV
jgi:subtilase family serine protease